MGGGLDLSSKLGKTSTLRQRRLILLAGRVSNTQCDRGVDGNDADLPDVHPIRGSETDDLGAWLVLDEVVHFAVRNEIFVRRVLREVRKLQVMEISRVRIFGILLIPEVLEDEGIRSRQS
jgi:hypothetical protein